MVGLPCLLLPSTLFEKILGKLGIYLPSFFVLLVYQERKVLLLTIDSKTICISVVVVRVVVIT